MNLFKNLKKTTLEKSGKESLLSMTSIQEPGLDLLMTIRSGEWREKTCSYGLRQKPTRLTPK